MLLRRNPHHIVHPSWWSLLACIVIFTLGTSQQLNYEPLHHQPGIRDDLTVLDSSNETGGSSSSNLLMTSVAGVIHNPVRSSRQRRDIFHLYNMMSCTTQCDPLSYKGYGCYCGFLGHGHAVDAIDRCCKRHDYCYGETACKHQSLIYFVPYKWKCNGGSPVCVLPYGELKASDICAHHLCECDRQFAECLRYLPCPQGKKASCPSNPLRSLG